MIDISIVTMSYGRTWLLTEAIESFLREADSFNGTAEMVIVNDMQGQTLKYDNPRVRVYNEPNRFDNHNDKTDYAISLAKGKHCSIQDDDDIFLPHRFTWQLGEIKKNNLLVHHLPYAYFTHREMSGEWNIEACSNNLFWTSCMFERRLWEESGGCKHPTEHNDQVIFKRMREKVTEIARESDKKFTDLWCEDKESTDKTFELYRWNDKKYGIPHLSGIRNRKDAEKAFDTWVRKHPLFESGVIELKPKWDQDYQETVREFNK